VRASVYLVQQRLRNEFVRRVVVFDGAKHGDRRRRLQAERGGRRSVRDCVRARREGAGGRWESKKRERERGREMNMACKVGVVER
jgi:hypothetical protein